MEKLIIYIDMDGVLCNFDKAAQDMREKLPFETELKPSATYESSDKGFKFDEALDFSKFEPMPDALDSVQKIIDMGHEVYIATTPPWGNPDAWGQKRNWVEEHLPQLKRKMFLTHRKDLLIGDVLIDDSTYRGQPEFSGTWFHFGKNGMDWRCVVEEIKGITDV
mgnify:FL=1